MISAQVYIIVAVVVLALVFIGTTKFEPKKLSPLAAVAFGFIIAGIVFGENRMIGYSFFAAGIILSIVDIFIKSKK